MALIQPLWDSYAKTVVPKGASQVQFDETRNAFYAGAAAAIAAHDRIAAVANEDMAVKMLDELHAEVREFIASIGS